MDMFERWFYNMKNYKHFFHFFLWEGRRLNSILDVAKFFLSRGDQNMTHKKLQKLCYYAYAWNLALRNEHLFNEKFEAWVHGPVSRELYTEYREYGWQPIPAEDSPHFDQETLEILEVVYENYGHLTGDELEALTHTERPWIEARGNLAPYEPSTEKIDDVIIREYYLDIYEHGQND